MRKITTEASLAFLNMEDYKKDNTRVEVIRQPHMTDVHLYLHWNEIARSNGKELHLDDCGWKTNTTKERINWLLYWMGLKIQQVKGEWYIKDSSHTWDFDNVDYIDRDTCLPVLYALNY